MLNDISHQQIGDYMRKICMSFCVSFCMSFVKSFYKSFCLFVSLIGFPLMALSEPYSAPFWLPNGHLQTVFAATLASTPKVNYNRERWELPDGDFVDVDWVEATINHTGFESAQSLNNAITENVAQQNISHQSTVAQHVAFENMPIVVLFHGLEGSSQSAYALNLMAAVKAKGWRGVVVHFRGCSGEPNRLPRAYYAGDTAEMQLYLSRLREKAPSAPIYAAGFSLGGNALLKWLGETNHAAKTIITKAVAVSAPMDLAASATALDTGLNRILYTPNFVNSLRPKALGLLSRFPQLQVKGLVADNIKAAKTIHDIDNAVTAVLYGASNADDYYAKNAAKPWLESIALPTLILNAKNDPFIPAQSLPTNHEVSSLVTLEYPESGGHVGFSGRGNWLAEHIITFFDSQ